MLQTLSLFELVLFAMVWLVIGALPGYYLALSAGYRPRIGAQAGSVIGLVIGIAAATVGGLASIEGLFGVAALLWAACLIVGLGILVTGAGRGDHRQRASMSELTAELAYALLLPTFVIVIAIVVFPMIWNLVLSFRPVRTRDLIDLRVFSLDGISLGNFERVLRNSDQFFDVFFPTALDTAILLAILAIGYWGGRWLGRKYGRESQAGWLGLALGIVLVMLFTGDRAYSESVGMLLAGRGFMNTLLRTFVYTLGGSVLAIAMGTVAALIVKDEFLGRNVVRGFMLFPYIAPIVSVVFVWKLLLNAQFGLINELIDGAGGQRIDFLSQPSTAFLMIVLFQGWRYFPFAFLFILARIQAIPEDMYEASQVDGALPSQRLIYITLPQLQAVFGTLFVLRFIWTFNKFDDVFLLTGGSANTQLVTIEIFDQLFSRSNIGTSSAVAVILAIVLMIVLGIYFKWFMVEDM